MQVDTKYNSRIHLRMFTYDYDMQVDKKIYNTRIPLKIFTYNCDLHVDIKYNTCIHLTIFSYPLCVLKTELKVKHERLKQYLEKKSTNNTHESIYDSIHFARDTPFLLYCLIRFAYFVVSNMYMLKSDI